MEEENVALDHDDNEQVEVVEQVLEDMQTETVAEDEAPPEETKEETVPLSAHIKMRKRAQEAELKAQWFEQQQQQILQQKMPAPPEEEDTSKYESATKADLGQIHTQTDRLVEEKLWIRENREKYEYVNHYLPDFLKQRPNLASAINDSLNRYEEAYTLMTALTQKEQKQMKPAQAPKKPAPGSPSGIPKAAAMAQSVDVMSMNDKEFNDWKAAQKKNKRR